MGVAVMGLAWLMSHSHILSCQNLTIDYTNCKNVDTVFAVWGRSTGLWDSFNPFFIYPLGQAWFADLQLREGLRAAVREAHQEQKILIATAAEEVSRICEAFGW